MITNAMVFSDSDCNSDEDVKQSIYYREDKHWKLDIEKTVHGVSLIQYKTVEGSVVKLRIIVVWGE